MTVEYEDGIKIIRLQDCSGQKGRADDGLVMARIWQLLTGGHGLRDATAFCHRL